MATHDTPCLLKPPKAALRPDFRTGNAAPVDVSLLSGKKLDRSPYPLRLRSLRVDRDSHGLEASSLSE